MRNKEGSKYPGRKDRRMGRDESDICLNISQRPTVVMAEVPHCVISFSVSLVITLPFIL